MNPVRPRVALIGCLLVAALAFGGSFNCNSNDDDDDTVRVKTDVNI